MRHLEILVEEPSTSVVLNELLPKLIASRGTFCVRNLGSKPQLLRDLPARLRGYARQIRRNVDLRVLVLVDEDRDHRGCRALKTELEDIAHTAGLATKARPKPDGTFEVVTRLAVEELEAWLLGDVEAIRAEYGRIPAGLANRQGFRDPDAVSGGTCERLHRLLQQHGYHAHYFPKVEFARKVAPHLEPARNRSRSFAVFRAGVAALLG